MRRSTWIVFLAGMASTAVVAQPPSITVQQAPCVPTERNGVITASVKPETGATTRLYFRWDEHGAPYYVDMFPDGNGAYWGIPAKPEPRNETIEYYVSVLDGFGKEIAKSETVVSPVRDDCRVELTPKQIGVSNNLVIGETVPPQQGRRVLGFLCDGIVTRINSEGIMRPDEICRGCVIPWWTKEEFLGAGAVAGVTTIILQPPPEPSPSRP